jgi:hypothetical protein
MLSEMHRISKRKWMMLFFSEEEREQVKIHTLFHAKAKIGRGSLAQDCRSLITMVASSLVAACSSRSPCGPLEVSSRRHNARGDAWGGAQ